jgi:hypothetical protein
MGPYVIRSFCAGLLCDGSFSDGTLCRGTDTILPVLGNSKKYGDCWDKSKLTFNKLKETGSRDIIQIFLAIMNCFRKILLLF